MFNSEIFSYTTEDAINDGMFIPLAQLPSIAPLVREAGISVPVIVTAGVYHDVIVASEHAKSRGEDEVGRAWDMLFLLAMSAKSAKKGESMIKFKLRFTGQRDTREEVLWAFIEPLSDGSPIIKIMVPSEY